MGKYLTIVLAMMVVTMAIAFISPLDGQIRQEPFYPLFWISVGGENLKNNTTNLNQKNLQDQKIFCKIPDIVFL